MAKWNASLADSNTEKFFKVRTFIYEELCKQKDFIEEANKKSHWISGDTYRTLGIYEDLWEMVK